jgi:DNA-binding LytR/AlgR family response regulator
MNVLIVEDEAPAREHLLKLVKEQPQTGKVFTAGSGLDAIEIIEKENPDLVFLDINLPDISGIDVLKAIHFRPEVIFCTAYDKYAVEAFEHNAVDFLLKPYPEERFLRSYGKAAEKIDRSGELKESINRLISAWQPRGGNLKRIPAKAGEKIFLIDTAGVCCFSSEERLVFAWEAERHFAINYTLDELERRLDPAVFFRIHRSTIVNLDYVESIEPWFAGTYKMRLKKGGKRELKISRGAAKKLRAVLGW